MPSLIGNKPNQVPTNGDLGRLAFMDNLDSFTSKTVMDTDITNIAPSLNLDFANSKVLDPRITFTRASTATFYNGTSSAVAEQNLLLQSQTFATGSWSTSAITFTSNSTTAPDGTATATTITATAGNTSHYSQSLVTTSAGIATASFYVKTNTAQYVQIFFNGDASSYANFDVVGGTVTVSSGTATGSIVSVGSGWYRCVAANTSTAVIGCGLAIIATSTSGRVATFNAAGTESAYIWGAQLEQRSAVTAYTPTTTAAVTNYIPTLSTAAAGVARFDHNPITGESLGLLIEEQRVNLLTYSDDFSNAAWVKGGATVTSNTIIAPDGALTGDKLNETTANSAHQVSVQTTLGNAVYTFSAYLKAGERSVALVRMSDNATGDAGATINLATGAVSNAGLTAGSWTNISVSSNAVGNGWYRVSVTATKGAGSIILSAIGIGSNTASYVGVENNGIYIWGAQLEAGSFATSYIPTVASQVTRSPEVAVMTGNNFSNWYNPAEGTVYVDTNTSDNTSKRVFSLSGAINPRLVDVYASGGPNRYVSFVNNVTTVDVSSTPQGLGIAKIAICYGSTGTITTQNGSAPLIGTTANTAVIAAQTTQLNIGSWNNASQLNGYIKKLSYYPRRLPNSELVEMTA